MNKINFYKVVFIALLAVFILNYFFVFYCFYDNDDINYARYASNFCYSNIINIQSQDHFAHRLLPIVFTGVFYKLFGINIISTTLLGFISCLLLGTTIYTLVKRTNNQVLVLIAVGSFFLNYETVYHSHRLLADVIVAALVFVAFKTYLNVDDSSTIKQIYFSGITISLLLFLAVLSKETIYITIPLWIYLFFKDCIKKKNIKLWIFIISSFALLTFIYLLIYKIETGSWLYRFWALEKNKYANDCSYDILPAINVVKRVAYGLLNSFLEQGSLILLIPAFCCCFYVNKIEITINKIKLIATSFLILFLSANFLSISFTAYLPLCPDPRQFFFLTPFACILSAIMLVNYFRNPYKYFVLFIMFLIADIALIFSNLGFTKLLYYSITVLLVIPYLQLLLKMQLFGTKIYCYIFLLIVSIKTIRLFFIEPYPFYKHQQAAINSILTTQKKSTIYCNSFETLEHTEFMLKFKTDIANTFLIDNYIDSNKSRTLNSCYFLLNCASKYDMASFLHKSILQQNPEVKYKKLGSNVYLYSIINSKDLINIKDLINNFNF